ncbi:phosphate ABC transporter, permease protein PstA, partial [Streptomyces anthocyanicus]
MSHAVQERPVAFAKPRGPLSHARLPRWTPIAVAAGSVAAGIGIGLAAGWHSKVQWGMISALLFVLGTYAITTKVEGSRQAKDRVATSLVWVCFVLAVI